MLQVRLLCHVAAHTGIQRCLFHCHVVLIFCFCRVWCSISASICSLYYVCLELLWYKSIVQEQLSFVNSSHLSGCFQVSPFNLSEMFKCSVSWCCQIQLLYIKFLFGFLYPSLCTTLSLQWEPEIIAVAVMYLAGRLCKFEIQEWTSKPMYRRWWEQFVQDVPVDVLEGMRNVCQKEEYFFQLRDLNHK